MGMNVNAQKLNLAANVEPVIINYNGIKVKAKKLTVHSEIPMRMDIAWNNVKTPALLEFVAKGMLKFKSVDGPLLNNGKLVKHMGLKLVYSD